MNLNRGMLFGQTRQDHDLKICFFTVNLTDVSICHGMNFDKDRRHNV